MPSDRMLLPIASAILIAACVQTGERAVDHPRPLLPEPAAPIVNPTDTVAGYLACLRDAEDENNKIVLGQPKTSLFSGKIFKQKTNI